MNDAEQFIEALKDHTKDDTQQFEALTNAMAGIAKDIGRLSEKMDERFDTIDKKMEPLLEAYNGVIFGKKIVTGVAAVFIAFAAIGGGIVWVVNAAISKSS